MAQLRLRPGGKGVALSEHELELLTAPVLRRLIDGGTTTVIVPFGSVEHQDAHLPLGADSLLADLVGREVARRLGAVLAPTVRVGCAEERDTLPGTISVGPETLTDTAVALAESLAAQGFRLVVLLSIHGGNTEALGIAVARLNESFGNQRVGLQGADAELGAARFERFVTSIVQAARRLL